MQVMLTSLIILLALRYLLAKWLPQNIKQKLHGALSKLSPGLAAFFSKGNSTVAASCSACSSCSGCADTTTKPSSSNPSKTIRLIRNLKF
ncbi:hypothetical protein [Undibacterium parvum]|uniref:Uncharacterized protein n=1 Tax=Undibacterium parvum TaxID=401471 RepID=A0A3S9HPN6_9BURK|nr:hypothetical protein [Undibacterium parvum]AZP14082.1 hypothetical protein EJN92_20010 [Undibacterium parvum]